MENQETRKIRTKDKKSQVPLSNEPIGTIKHFNTELVIAGHGDIYRDFQSRTILKGLQPPPKGDREIQFYKDVTAATTPVTRQLRSLCPRFHGIVWDKEQGYLRLEDLTRPFKNPCIMDIKIGRVTADPLASEAKRKREEAKYPPLKKTGFQLLGCRIGGDHHHEKLDKKWGRALDETQLLDGLDRFLSGGGSPERKDRVRRAIVDKLAAIRAWFEMQTQFHFYASSVLILYEGFTSYIGSQASSDSDEEHNSEQMPLVDVRMIDFAHVFDACGHHDENYLFGLDNLISSFQSV